MKILLAVSRFPWPARRGDQLRTVQMVELLSTEHDVTVLAPEPERGCEPPERFHGRLVTYRVEGTAAAWKGVTRAAGRGLPLQSGLYYQPDLGRKLRELAPQADVGVLQLVRLAVHRDDLGDTPFVLDLIDSLSLNFSRRAQLDRMWMRPLLRVEARLLSTWEHRLLQSAVAGVLVCERDRLALSRRRLLPPDVATRLAVVPLAVRERREPRPPSPPGGRPILAFTGNLGYFVNDDAAQWFLRRVWPQLRRRTDARLVIAGERPGHRLRRLVAASGAELVESPADLRDLLAAAAVSLAPMRGGSGLPIKILEAWSVGVPVVASPWAAAGTSGAPGVDLVVAEQPGEWLHAILTLLADADQRARLAASGRARLRSAYSRQTVRRQLLQLFGRLAGSAGAPLAGPAVEADLVDDGGAAGSAPTLTTH